jgi:hypothetical protein
MRCSFLFLFMAGVLQAAPPAEEYRKAHPRAASEKSFLVTWVDSVPSIRIDGTLTATVDELEGYKSGDVAISGPWHDGRHVWYATLHKPSDAEVKAALKKARAELEGVKPAASPFAPSNSSVDGELSLPVGSHDALDELNAMRAARGLRPYIRDNNLTRAAIGAALYRAERRIFGHCPNDFVHVPNGSSASAAGCAAYPAEDGFLACCMFDSYTYAGAYSVKGADGRMYHHLFVRR